jgi:MFS family permease
MQLIRFLKARNWTALFGYALFTGMMATGYYYNLTFIQFGLLDLGTRRVGMSEQSVAMHMAVLALLTCLVAILTGYMMKRRGWSQQLFAKLRLAFGVVLTQTLLTAAAPLIRSEAAFLAWIVVASLALGVGVPATFSLTVDLIPRRDRGYVAALVTSAAYFAAAVFSSTWTIEAFSAQVLWLMLAGTLGLGLFAFKKFAFMDQLAQQHSLPEFGRGRFVRLDAESRPRVRVRLVVLIVLMFGIFFVDSLGFLRLAHTPIYFETAWQSPDIDVRLFIGVTHVIAALIGGVIYTAMTEKQLFLWIFGIFALVHLMYTFDIGFPIGDGDPSLSMPLLYAIAVSLYTVVNFAIWADVSTPQTISLNTALGVALSGWTATFISTALALQWRLGGMPLEQHLRIVDALAFLFFLAVMVLSFLPEGGRRSNSGRKLERNVMRKPERPVRE